MLHPAAPAEIGMPVFLINEGILPEQTGEDFESIRSDSPPGHGSGVLVGIRMIDNDHRVGR